MNVVSEAAIVRRCQRIVRVLIVIGRLLLAGALRLQQLAQLPPGVFFDEGANGLDALKVLHRLPEITLATLQVAKGAK